MARNPVGHTLNACSPAPETQTASAPATQTASAPATQAASARYWLEVKAGIIPGSRYC
jgi:hypothetical protein